MKIRLFYVIILTIIVISTTFAQDKTLGEKLVTGTENIIKDTLEHKYNFVVGDTLEYRVESADSIIVNWGSALLKKRYERIRLVCEKIDKKTGHFFISYQYDQYLGYEDKLLYKRTQRDHHPWLNKKVTIEIDSLGENYSYEYSDTTSKGFTAGGPFQGLVLQPIGRKTSTKGQSWIIKKDTSYLAENGYPTPKSILTYLVENKGEVDTLESKCVRIDNSFTGGSEVFVNNDNALFLMTAGQNGHSENYLSEEYHIPIWVYYTQEQNFEMELGNNKSSKGKHLSYSIFQLDRFVKGKDRTKQKKQSKNN